MPDWTLTTLADLIDVKHGFAFKGEYFFDGPPGDVLLTPGNFAIGGGFKRDKFKYYRGPVPSEFVLKPGDLLVTMTDLSKAADTLGYPAFVPNDGQRYLHNQRLGKIELKSTNVSLDFLYWLMRTDVYRNEVLSSYTGSTVKHTSPTKIRAFRFDLPSPPEREAICYVLRSLDDKIELNLRMNETLERMAQAIFRDWFVDFGPVRRKLDGASDPVKIMGGLAQDKDEAAHLADLFPGTIADNCLPEGWGEVNLSAYSDLNPESWTAKNHPEDIEYVDLANTKWGTIESTTEYSWVEAPSRAKRVLKSGDTIVGTVRPANGSFAFIGRSGLTGSTGFAALRPKRKEYIEFVYLAACRRENIETLGHLADGGAYPAVRPEIVLATPAPAVSQDITLIFSAKCAPLIQKIETAKVENQTLAALRDLLLPRLMSGEIRLKEAEKLAEAAE